MAKPWPAPRRALARLLPFLVLVMVAGAAGGCQKPKKRLLTKEQQQRIADSVLASAPALPRALDANFGNKIKLLGVTIAPAAAAPGDKVTATYYWQSLEALEGDWKVFVHLEQPGKRQILDHHAVEDLHPIRNWKVGDIIKDEQTFEVDRAFKPGKAVLWVGLFDEAAWQRQQKSDRLPLVDATNVPHDDGGRVRAGELEIKGGAAGAKTGSSAPKYQARPAGGPIEVDGKLTEAGWKQAPKTRVFLRPDGRPSSREMNTRAQALYDATHLYLAFEVQDSDIASTHVGRDQRLWEQDVVEVFLDPGSDGKNYIELQVSPTNAVFDAVFEEKRRPKWEEAAKVDLDIRSGVAVEGTVNQEGDADTRWTVELAIPYAGLPGVSAPPAPGTSWALNLYRIDQAGPRNMAYQATWAPVGGDFHELEGAGILEFADAPAPAPAPVAQPAPAAAPAPPAAPPAEAPPAPPSNPAPSGAPAP
jgi:hypothetical protein